MSQPYALQNVQCYHTAETWGPGERLLDSSSMDPGMS
jgi:hypothetical protein